MKKILFTSVLAVLLSFSCTKSDDPGNSTDPNTKIKNQLSHILDSVIQNTHVPGLVAGIWAPDRGLDYVHTAGVSDLETKAQLHPQMTFRAGSNTKTFVITILLQLVDEKLVSLNDPLSKYLPDFPRGHEVTLEMLTNMKSGIYDYTTAPEFLTEIMEHPTRFWTTGEMIDIAASHPYDFDPGNGFKYCNSNTMLAGFVIEKVTGISLESNIKTRIIDPLNLVNTQYLVGGTQIPGFHSNGYYGGVYHPSDPEVSEYFDVSFLGAAGSMVSDIYELKTYVKALTTGNFLSPELQQWRFTVMNDWGKMAFVNYGPGIMEYKGFFGHSGSIYGFTSLMVHSPAMNCTVIIWYNSQIEGTTPIFLLPELVKVLYPELF